MKSVLCGILASLFLFSSIGAALAAKGAGSHDVRGYTTKKGTYVAPHKQTNPNGSKSDNWSTRGNVNPYTGKPGTKNPN